MPSRLTMHLSDSSSVVQHLEKHSCPTTEFWKDLTDNTTILDQTKYQTNIADSWSPTH